MENKKLIKKKDPELSNTNKRIPRPNGITFLSKQFQSIRSDENKDRLYAHIISYYTFNGFRWNGKPTPLPEMAQILKISTNQIMEYISKISLNLGTLVDPEKIDNTLKSIITLSTTWSIQDRGTIQAQVENLLRSQGGAYKPFVSAETNKSLKLLLESNKNLMENYKIFFTSTNPQVNILNIFNKAKQDPNSLITPELALNLIQKNKQPALPSLEPIQELNTDLSNMGINQESLTGILAPEALKDIFQDHAIGDLDSVLEGRTGTEALLPIPAPNLRAPELTDSEKAIKRELLRNAASSSRRGLKPDSEELPNRAEG